MFDPTCQMPTRRIMVRPVNDASFGIPFIFPVKGYPVTCVQSVHPRRQVNIVSHQKRLPIGKLYDESLVPDSRNIILKDFGDRSLTLDLNVVTMLLERYRNGLIAAIVGGNLANSPAN